MKPAAFDYIRAEHLDEALDAIGREGSDARILAGGQSLMPMLNMRLAKPSTIIDIMRLTELNRIDSKAGAITVGAGVRQASLLDWPDLGRSLRLAALALPWTGHAQTRSRGTVCGSIAHADPSAEINVYRPSKSVPARESIFLCAIEVRERVRNVLEIEPNAAFRKSRSFSAPVS